MRNVGKGWDLDDFILSDHRVDQHGPVCGSSKRAHMMHR